jgi:hypothetical protein
MRAVAGAPEPVVHVADGVYTVRTQARGEGEDRVNPARSAFIVGPRGVVVVDSGLAYADGRAILDAIARTTRAPVRLLVLTHPSQEAIFGAAAFDERGIPVAMHADAAALVASRCEACLGRLRAALGEAAMQGTRVVAPVRTLRDGDVLHDTGRALRIIAPGWASAPGAIAVLDVHSSTLVAGSLVALRAVPDLRDADVPRWREALVRLEATHCAHLVPAYGAPGRCVDIPSFARYLDDLEARVRALLAQGLELGDIGIASALPRYAAWEGYGERHAANANRTYLRLEREALEAR